MKNLRSSHYLSLKYLSRSFIYTFHIRHIPQSSKELKIMSREKKIIWGVLLVSLFLWAMDAVFVYSASDWGVWLWRKELINLTGVMILISMGLIMLLAIRPKFLEKFFHGLDKTYYVHKWLGIIAILSVILHYGIKLSKGMLQTFFEKGPKVPSSKLMMLEDYRDFAKDLGEIYFYLFVAMLAITLIHRIPYRIWRVIHKVMPILFLGAIFHGIVLAPARYWQEPVGIVFIIMIAFGGYASIVSLFGLIGKQRQFTATIVKMKQEEDISVVTCQLNQDWKHQAGQYAFVQHEGSKEKHPFTIASVVNQNQEIRFAIKALGHYTRKIPKEWKAGDKITIEGPYGEFLFKNSPLASSQKQIWIAGGVGITPFVAWLESLEGQQLSQDITLYYCVNHLEECLVPEYLAKLAESSGITLKIHCSNQEGYLNPESLTLDKDTSVWFCGPSAFAKKIEKTMRKKGLSVPKQFHREYFNMR